MTRAAPPQLSFSSGEISPILRARPDLQRYQTALRRCRGFMPLPEGAVTRMPGTRHAGTTRNNAKARIEPFIFSETDAHVLEFTSGIMRVWRNGALVEASGNPFELVVPWDEEDLPNLRFAQSGSRIYVTDGQRAPQRISRLAIDDWTIEPVPFERGPFLRQNTDEQITIQASGTSGEITLTASSGVFEAGQVGAFFRIEPEDEDDIPYWTGNTEVSTGDLMRYDGAVYEIIGFADATVSEGNTGPNPPIHQRGTWLSSSEGPKWEYLHGDAGIVKISAVSSPTSATAITQIDLPSGIVSAPSSFFSEGAWSALRGYPSTLAFHEQRLVFGASKTDQQTLWFSAVDDFVNFEPSTNADGSFAYAIASERNRLNKIHWIVSGGRTLHIGTSGAEYSARSSSSDVVIGPTNAVFRPDTSEGSRNIPPLTVDGAPVFVARDGKRVHELSYDFGEDRVGAPEISRYHRHLFRNVKEVEWQTTPWRVIWAVNGDGTVAVLAYDKRQEQIGAAQTSAGGGLVESLAVLPTDDGDSEHIYFSVQRGSERHIEISQPVFGLSGENAPIANAWHLWDALEYAGDPRQVFSGLDHLEGADVYAWTDQGSIGPRTVVDGQVDLGIAVTKAIIGLDDDTDRLQTLHQSAGAADGGSQGRMNRVKAAGFQFYGTSKAYLRTLSENNRSRSETALKQIIPAQPDAFAAHERFNGTLDVTMSGGWARTTYHAIRPEPGGPLTLTGITPILQMADS